MVPAHLAFPTLFSFQGTMVKPSYDNFNILTQALASASMLLLGNTCHYLLCEFIITYCQHCVNGTMYFSDGQVHVNYITVQTNLQSDFGLLIHSYAIKIKYKQLMLFITQ